MNNGQDLVFEMVGRVETRPFFMVD